MLRKVLLFVSALVIFPVPSCAQTTPQESQCSTFFGVLQYDPNAPGHLVARMSASQANWFAKSGQKRYPGICLALEKAQYLIVWTIATDVTTTEQTVQRTARVNTSTTGRESGTFSTYGDLSTWGTYSGRYSSESSSTITYSERVPVSVTTDYCLAYVLKSVGPTVWDDIRNKTPQPPAIFSFEARGSRKVYGGDPATGGLVGLGGLIRRAVSGEPTTKSLDAALKFISEQGAHVSAIAVPEHTVVVQVTSEPTGAEITVDGSFVGSTPSELRLSPGKHELVISKPGRKTWERTLQITGDKTTVHADLE